jgi:hypothetical protein
MSLGRSDGEQYMFTYPNAVGHIDSDGVYKCPQELTEEFEDTVKLAYNGTAMDRIYFPLPAGSV